MSEPIPESIPTSQDPRSHRPLKRRALSPASQQANQVDALFANPDRDIKIPDADSLKPRGVAPPPEIVANVQGSSAGAGSGEFHVYKASRRREYERLRLMDEESRREKEAEDFERDREEKKEKEDKRAGKNKARRDKAKERKANKGKGSGVIGTAGAKQSNGATEGDQNKKAKIEPRQIQRHDDEDITETAATAETTATTKPDEPGLVIHDDDD